MINLTYFGTKLKNLRKLRNLTQIDLADGICSKNYIIKLEQGKCCPSAYVLTLLSNKLKTNLFDLISLCRHSKPDEVMGIRKEIDQLREQQDFYQLQNKVKSAYQHVDFIKGYNFQFLLWHQAICLYEIQGLYDSSIHYLDMALKITANINLNISPMVFTRLDHQEIDIILTICYFYLSQENYTSPLSITISLYRYVKRSLPQYTLPYQKILKLLSLILYKVGKYKASYTIIKKLISFCYQHYSSYHLDEIYLLQSRILNKLNQDDLARSSKELSLLLSSTYLSPSHSS